MPQYMLAQIRLRYGTSVLTRYDAVMGTVRRFFEGQGVVLRHGLVTRVGPLYEAWNLWEIRDQGHIERAFRAYRGAPLPEEYAGIMGALADVVVEEQVRFLEALPFSST